MDLVFQVLGEGKHDHQLKLLEYKGQMSSLEDNIHVIENFNSVVKL